MSQLIDRRGFIDDPFCRLGETASDRNGPDIAVLPIDIAPEEALARIGAPHWSSFPLPGARTAAACRSPLLCGSWAFRAGSGHAVMFWSTSSTPSCAAALTKWRSATPRRFANPSRSGARFLTRAIIASACPAPH